MFAKLLNVKSLRFYSFLPFLVSVLMLAYAYYEQYVEHLDPCPLCLAQRFVIMLIGLLYFLTFIIPPQKLFRKIVAFFIAIVCLSGAAVSARHVYLQHLPADEVPACGPGLEYMLQNLPLGDVFHNLFSGSGECAEITWRFLGLTMPEWTLIIFIGFFLYTLGWALQKKREN